MKLGKFDIFSLHVGLMHADGGAVFGVVPKTIWGKKWATDADNRIALALRPLLIKTGRELVLIDTGAGRKMSPETRQRYGIEPTHSLADELAAHQVTPEDITIVILSHLHFDHVGGATQTLPDGTIGPTFPHARYIVNRIEWQTAHNPDPRSASSYLAENMEPLRRQLEFVNGRTAITMGIWTQHTGGHTKGHQAVFIESDGQQAMFWADIMPTTSHIKATYPMGYDLYPAETIQVKARLIPQAIREKWLCIFNHDPKTPFGYLHAEGDAVRVQPIAAD